MRHLAAPLALLLSSPLAGCSLSRSTLGGAGVDAERPDAFAVDAPVPIDDTDIPDAFTPPDMGMDSGPSCVATSVVEMTCDRIDDDCDGTIDDDGICGGCIAFTIAGHAYLSCPGPITGMQAWTGQCGVVAPGYELATLPSATVLTAVAAFLHAQIATDPHWIGLNDFGTPGTYVWRDRSTTFVPSTISPADPMKRFVVLRNDGGYEQAVSTDTHRFLCEAARMPGACAAHEASGCNGVDENCNGLVDEGQNCGPANCMANVFWDHVYYVCSRNRKSSDATSDCMGIGGGIAIVSLHDPVEHQFLGALISGDTWIGLTQDPTATAIDGGWRWADGSMSYGVPAMRNVAPWGSNEPDDNGSPTEGHHEDCALLVGGAPHAFDDRSCNDMHPFVCERGWTY